MSGLAKSFNPAEHEEKILKLWEESGFFNPDNLKLPKNAPAYTIILPPPNVTDRLHLGHASMLAIEDLLIRFKRMNGFRTLWLPGTDHAAIATQAVVEKDLYSKTKQTRHDLGREKFLKLVKDFSLETQKTILNQIKRMGASLDWSRLAFTLDEPRQQAVRKMFIEMYEAGALYRGERIVNWCPRCQSTLADDELECKTEPTTLYTFKYDPNFPIAISTTRPETKLGDTAVAVNPKDERYKKLVGQEFSVNFCGQPLKIKIIADREVDPEFGTGALGVTPAHSMTDWRIAEINNLPIIKVINEQGKIRNSFSAYSGLSVKEARELIIKKLKEQKLLEKEETIEHNLAICYRCNTAIEPLPSLQWFVAVDKPLKKLKNKSLKQTALEVVKENKIEFVPQRFTKRYLDWLANLRDWCISRQIWFGHEIPAWYKESQIYVGQEAPAGDGWQKDEDTLDTWFSSGMWTFSTLGWPASAKAMAGKPSDLERFHPTDVLETGYEIITLWVSRMIMMSLFALGEIPFKTVYLHGMVLDKEGKKMSKSKGNGLDPVTVAEQYGVDAVRLSLLLGNTPGNDSRINEEKIASFRNFSNKLWNISRYILNQRSKKIEVDYKSLTLSDDWILSRLQTTIINVTEKIKDYNFSNAGEVLRKFTLDDLADWYLEVSKFEISSNKLAILENILETILKLWHPFMPFVTEAIWNSFNDKLLLVESWPKASKKLINEQAEKEFEIIRDVIIKIRNLRSEGNIPMNQKIHVAIWGGKNEEKIIENYTELVKFLKTQVEEITIKEPGDRADMTLYARVGSLNINVMAKGNIDSEKKRQGELKLLIKNLKEHLQDKEFVSKAPEKIVVQEKNKLMSYEAEMKKISERLEKLSS